MGSATNPHTCLKCGNPLTATYIYTPRGWVQSVTWRCPLCDPTENPASATVPRADYEALLRERDEVVRRCPLCRAELDPDEMDPAYTGGMTELRPAGAGVCSECYGRWHDAPVYAKRAKDATARAEKAEAALRDARGTVPAFCEAHREIEVIPGPFCPACLAIQCRADGHKSGIDMMRVVSRDATTAPVDAVERDAARFRWLMERNFGFAFDAERCGISTGRWGRWPEEPDEQRAMIDRAIAAEASAVRDGKGE